MKTQGSHVRQIDLEESGGETRVRPDLVRSELVEFVQNLVTLLNRA